MSIIGGQFPREIHQTWKTSRPAMEPHLRHCVDSMESVNSGWEHRYYDDDDMTEAMKDMSLIATENFNSLTKGVEKADVFRCAILHQRGGVYCDVDIEAIRPLDELLEKARDEGIMDDDTEILLTYDHPLHRDMLYGGREILMNHFMIARPGARILGLYLFEMNRRIQGGELSGNDPVHTTGPAFLTHLVEQFGGTDELNIGIIPSSWINPLPDVSWDTPEMQPYRQMIEDECWRSNLEPFMAHYWWHNYCGRRCIFDLYGDRIFGDAEDMNMVDRFYSKNDNHSSITESC